jgi:hypothetical protein
MSKLISTVNCSLNSLKRMNSKELLNDENKLLSKFMNKKNEIKNEYDIKENEISEIENLINSKLICNIGYGGFSTVKLIFSNIQKTYFALKVV